MNMIFSVVNVISGTLSWRDRQGIGKKYFHIKFLPIFNVVQDEVMVVEAARASVGDNIPGTVRTGISGVANAAVLAGYAHCTMTKSALA